jgi:hypothetical protein
VPQSSAVVIWPTRPGAVLQGASPFTTVEAAIQV